MDNQIPASRGLSSQRLLEIYVCACVLLVLIILFGAFQRAGGGALSGEIYLRDNVVQVDGE